MSFWVIALFPQLKVCSFRFGSWIVGDTARLLSQNVAEPVSIEKEVQPRAVRRPRLQVIQGCLQRNVAHDAGQSPRQIRRLLVRKQSGGNSGGAPQLHQRYTVKICIQLIERTEYGK